MSVTIFFQSHMEEKGECKHADVQTDATTLYRASVELSGRFRGLQNRLDGEYSFPKVSRQEAKGQDAQDAQDTQGDEGGGTHEYSLELTEAHAEYVRCADSILDDFLSHHKTSKEKFLVECRESLEGKHCALFEEDVNEWFVTLLLGISDFRTFCTAMESV